MYGNVSHVTFAIHPRLRVASSIDNDKPDEPRHKGDLICLFVGDVQISFGYADAVESIDAMAGWLDRLRAQVLALPERESFDPADGSFDPLPDPGDHHAYPVPA